VLDAFDEVYACTAYEVNGTKTREMPFQLTSLDVKPVWEKYAGWSDEAAANSKFYNELPAEMKAFVKEVEAYLKVPVKYVSNGPGRDQILEQ
jgi:adenylosuccinate synthase